MLYAKKHSLVTHEISLVIRTIFPNLRSVIFKRYEKHILFVNN